jgi:hypothetical protein
VLRKGWIGDTSQIGGRIYQFLRIVCQVAWNRWTWFFFGLLNTTAGKSLNPMSNLRWNSSLTTWHLLRALPSQISSHLINSIRLRYVTSRWLLFYATTRHSNSKISCSETKFINFRTLICFRNPFCVSFVPWHKLIQIQKFSKETKTEGCLRHVKSHLWQKLFFECSASSCGRL